LIVVVAVAAAAAAAIEHFSSMLMDFIRPIRHKKTSYSSVIMLYIGEAYMLHCQCIRGLLLMLFRLFIGE